MQEINGQCKQSFFILHGGAGPRDPKTDQWQEAIEALLTIAKNSYKSLQNHKDHTLTTQAIEQMEKHPIFNAGIGAALQADGEARVTASYMDSRLEKFSAVINQTENCHPSKIASYLQNESYTVLADPGAKMLAEKLQLPAINLKTEKRLEDYNKLKQQPTACDTVGCVSFYQQTSQLAAMTSTGGVGFETPGRISDCATVAGNYCSKKAAISATGIGEQIVNSALAARLETRVHDGMTLMQASHICFQEALEKKYQYGWIAIDNNGNWNVSFTTNSMLFVVCDSSGQIISSSLKAL
ncbi:MAG: isoaspartyl peptidase/L-asparaginase [Bdellovibrionota bacterium]